MKKTLLFLLPLMSMVVSCTSQQAYSKTMIKEASAPIKTNYSDSLSADYEKLLISLYSFSDNFLDKYYSKENDIDKNFAISPLSLYFALAMVVECSGGNTRDELLTALNISYSDLKNNIKYLYSFSNYGDPDKPASGQHFLKQLNNSVWLTKNIKFKDDCINALANDFYASSFAEDFQSDNKNANKRLSQYVSDKTRGLINQKFELDRDTIFVLLNTLYLKSTWNQVGKRMPKTSESYDFKNANNTVTNTKLLHDGYKAGRILKTDKYSSFYVSTNNAIRIKFIVPNDGCSLDDIMNKETFDSINREKYNYIDEAENKIYYTEINFPEYEADNYFDASEILTDMGVKDLFSSKCNFSNLTDTPSTCSGVLHSTKLKVDDLGIEGAAFTAVIGATSAGPGPYEEVYETFTVDKAFGYIIYDNYDSPIFSGAVNKI